jgi:uncharacterized cupin superfamily protein
MTARILNLADLEFHEWSESGGAFAGRMGEIALPLGASKLGYNLTVVPPGKTAFPFHTHRVNEEMFFILEGEGELRLVESLHPLRPGDVICCPAGGPETAHQIRNVSETAELKYLAVSTSLSPEICEYPDSGKFAVSEYGGAGGRQRTFRHIGRAAQCLDYWD